MRRQPISPRGGILAVLALAILAAVVSGCGIGKASNEETISKTATTYLHALADGDTAKACAQLTRRAKGEQCEAAVKERLSRLDADALAEAADGSMDIDVDGNRATARLSEPEGARFLLSRAGAEWRIDSGYTLGSAAAADIPATPVGKQITWALAQLNGDAAALTEDAVAAHFTPEFLAVWMPARELVSSLQQTAAERGPFTFTGFAYPPTATQAVALIETKAGERGSLRIEVDGGKQARILPLRGERGTAGHRDDRPLLGPLRRRRARALPRLHRIGQPDRRLSGRSDDRLGRGAEQRRPVHARLQL